MWLMIIVNELIGVYMLVYILSCPFALAVCILSCRRRYHLTPYSVIGIDQHIPISTLKNKQLVYKFTGGTEYEFGWSRDQIKWHIMNFIGTCSSPVKPFRLLGTFDHISTFIFLWAFKLSCLFLYLRLRKG